MHDVEIIRNARKIDAVVHNAQQVLRLQQEHGSWQQWLEQQRGQSLLEWVKRFKQEFHFVGGEIVREFLVSTGYLPGAHDLDCPITQRIVGYVKSA
jgi:DNA-3-methyladenine glycosylase I